MLIYLIGSKLYSKLPKGCPTSVKFCRTTEITLECDPNEEGTLFGETTDYFTYVSCPKRPIYIEREREREREREPDRQTDGRTEQTDRKRQTEKEPDRERDRESLVHSPSHPFPYPL